MDGRRPLPLQDLHAGVSRRLPEGAGLPACRGLAGDEGYSPLCHWMELLLLCKSAQLAATIERWITNTQLFQIQNARTYTKKYITLASVLICVPVACGFSRSFFLQLAASFLLFYSACVFLMRTVFVTISSCFSPN